MHFYDCLIYLILPLEKETNFFLVQFLFTNSFPSLATIESPIRLRAVSCSFGIFSWDLAPWSRVTTELFMLWMLSLQVLHDHVIPRSYLCLCFGCFYWGNFSYRSHFLICWSVYLLFNVLRLFQDLSISIQFQALKPRIFFFTILIMLFLNEIILSPNSCFRIQKQ